MSCLRGVDFPKLRAQYTCPSQAISLGPACHISSAFMGLGSLFFLHDHFLNLEAYTIWLFVLLPNLIYLVGLGIFCRLARASARV